MWIRKELVMSKNSWKVVAIVEALLLLTTVAIIVPSRTTPDVNTSKTTAAVDLPVVAPTPEKVVYDNWLHLDEERDFFYSSQQKEVYKARKKHRTLMRREIDGVAIEYTEMAGLGKGPSGLWDDYQYLGTGKSYLLVH